MDLNSHLSSQNKADKAPLTLNNLSFKKESSCNLPTEFGNFTMHSYVENQKKIHHVLTMGELNTSDRILLRVHSKCCTGDVFYSTRCDCGFQLKESMQKIQQKKKGILIYLDQEGRDIGILNKIKAYSLQDLGCDTYEANRILGLPEDNRQYDFVVYILNHLKINKISLLSNNPEKINFLSAPTNKLDIKRIEIIKSNLTIDQKRYLDSKAKFKNHIIKKDNKEDNKEDFYNHKIIEALKEYLNKPTDKNRPFISLCFAQTIDGSIAYKDYKRAYISNEKSLHISHHLRSLHDGILVGVSTIIKDNPYLSARGNKNFKQPIPIILDSHLKTPIAANIISRNIPLIFLMSKNADHEKRKKILKKTPHSLFIEINYEQEHKLCLEEALNKLKKMGIKSVMVEGGSSVIKSFIVKKQIDYCIITISPQYLGGLDYKDEKGSFRLKDSKSYSLDNDTIITGIPQ